MSKNNNNSRRNFIKNAALTAGSFYIIPRAVLGGKGFIAPSDKLVIAGIGAGGKGESDLWNFYNSKKANIGFLCDVDDRQSVASRKRYPQALYFKDYREMLEKHHKSIDAVSVSTPDHMHGIQAMAAMQLGKHVYVQKPLAHDIYEARIMTEAARKYKVVTQMGNQGASGDGVRKLMEWYNAGIIGDVHTVYAYTDRPVWPQGVTLPKEKGIIPNELDWDLWLGTAPQRDYFENLLPFNWRGWWDYGTGALGDMACHNMAPPFAVLGLGYPVSAECSVATRYTQPWQKVFHPDCPPIASHIILTFIDKKNQEIKFHWMDGGILPERPKELLANEIMGDGGNGVIFLGTKGAMMCSTYGANPQLLPTKLTNEIKVPETLKRVKGQENGHYTDWVEACIAGYNSELANNLSSKFDISGPLTESVLMGNLAIRSYDLRKIDKSGKIDFPGRNIKLLWDGPNMKITNFEDANQFVKRTYRNGWSY